jgi:uncharacterized membrane protein
MADIGAISAGDASAFLISAGLVYEIIAAACSSPQTAEINASKRSSTLMKWVHLGLVQSAIFVGAGAWIAAKTDGNPHMVIAGGTLAAVMMYGSYWHALDAGLAEGGQGTET